MAAPHEYREPETPDSDPEDDLDLQELDPLATNGHTSSSRQPTRERSGKTRDYAKGIALKNLRRGRRQRHPSAERQGDGDLEGLLQDADDNAPLLGSEDEGAAQQDGESRKPSLAARLRPNSSIRGTGLRDILPSDAKIGSSRQISVGEVQKSRYPPNIISNAKYTPWSFLPRTLYNEFSFFFNMYFLLVALSQLIPFLRIGYMSTYVAPLVFVLSITLGKEAIDDIGRRRRDAEANSEAYTVLNFGAERLNSKNGLRTRPRSHPRQRNFDETPPSLEQDDPSTIPNEIGVTEYAKKSREIRVGDVLKLQKDQRLPADVVLLKNVSNDQTTTEAPAPDINEPGVGTPKDGSGSGEAFIRTDQLDGETDWKLRLALPLTQRLSVSDFKHLRLSADAPDKKVNEFVGTIEVLPEGKQLYDPAIDRTGTAASDGNAIPANNPNKSQVSPLTIDNTAWANTVLASNTTTYAVVIYTGPQTRSALSTSTSRSKTGLLEYEINSLTKILCALVLSLSIILVAFEGFEPNNNQEWYVAIMIYLILFSTIIPISLRVNLDMGKSVYAWFIERDQGIPGTVVRTSTIPEDLGRIEYLLSDKTGTLTQNGNKLPNVLALISTNNN